MMMNLVEEYYIEENNQYLAEMSKELAEIIEERNYSLYDNSVNSDLNTVLENYKEESMARIIILDENGIIVKDTDLLDSKIGTAYLTQEISNILGITPNYQTQKIGNEVLNGLSEITKNDKTIGIVILYSNKTKVQSPVSKIQENLIMYLVILLLLVTILVFLFSKYLINPLKNILVSVNAMSEGHLTERIDVTANDEFSELGNAFNIMVEKLELVEKTREEFVSNVSHELKTPLSSIKVLSEAILLQEDIPIETYQEFLGDITSEVDRMTDIVNDLLHLVKLNQREIALVTEEVDINKVVADVLKRLIPLAEEKNIALFFEEVSQVIVDGDEMKLSLAISNLVENGIKYTLPEGAVKVMIDGDNQNAFVTVQDTGIGISEDDQQLVFNRFYRVDKTRDRETGGTGLGLSITHSTVLLHNGSIRLRSKENHGSTFVMRLPIHQKETEEITNTATYPIETEF